MVVTATSSQHTKAPLYQAAKHSCTLAKRGFLVKIYRLRIFVLIGISYVSTKNLFSSGKYPHSAYLYTIWSAPSNICILNEKVTEIIYWQTEHFERRVKKYDFILHYNEGILICGGIMFDGRSKRVLGDFSGNITLITKSKSLDFLLLLYGTLAKLTK